MPLIATTEDGNEVELKVSNGSTRLSRPIPETTASYVAVPGPNGDGIHVLVDDKNYISGGRILKPGEIFDTSEIMYRGYEGNDFERITGLSRVENRG